MVPAPLHLSDRYEADRKIPAHNPGYPEGQASRIGGEPRARLSEILPAAPEYAPPQSIPDHQEEDPRQRS